MKTFLYKIFGLLINIDIILLELLFIGVALLFINSTATYGKYILSTVSILFLIIVVSPLASWSLFTLENYHPKLEKLPDDVKGMIILGGSFNRRATASRGIACYNNAAGRFINALELANQYPHLKILFTGGGHPRSNPDDINMSEAEIERQEFIKFKIDLDRVIFEGKSHDTRDNAALSYNLVKPKADEKWLLVTSASHLPRAMGLFRKIGWNVTACPVDYHTEKIFKWQLHFSIADSLAAWIRSSREWCAMLNNWLFGYSDHILPLK